MAVEVASAYVSLLPSFKGGARAIQRELTQASGTASQKAGRDAGQRFGSGFGASLSGGTNRIGNTLIASTGTASQRAGRDSGQRFGAGFGASLGQSTRGIGDGISDGTRIPSETAGRESGSRFGRLFASFSMPPLRGLGAAAVGLFAADSILSFFSSAIGEAKEARKVSALTRQVIKDPLLPTGVGYDLEGSGCVDRLHRAGSVSPAPPRVPRHAIRGTQVAPASSRDHVDRGHLPGPIRQRRPPAQSGGAKVELFAAIRRDSKIEGLSVRALPHPSTTGPRRPRK